MMVLKYRVLADFAVSRFLRSIEYPNVKFAEYQVSVDLCYNDIKFAMFFGVIIVEIIDMGLHSYILKDRPSTLFRQQFLNLFLLITSTFSPNFDGQ